MNIVKSIEEVRYDSPYFWDKNLNPLASVVNCLPDCTTLVIGAIKKSGLPNIVSSYRNANEYHKYLINGWIAVPYNEYKANIKVGDVIEWIGGNHIAIVSDTSNGVMISGSFYTGVHGKAYYDGKYDSRDGINSLKEADAFFFNNYPYRYFHYVSLETESQWCGGEPDLVLVSPMSITPTEKDTSKNQIYVGVTGLRVRTEPNTNSLIKGVASVGYYNVDEIVNGGQYDSGSIWYRIGELYVAGVNGVTYYSKDEAVPMVEMLELMKKMQDTSNAVCNERDNYKEMIDKIRKIVN